MEAAVLTILVPLADQRALRIAIRHCKPDPGAMSPYPGGSVTVGEDRTLEQEGVWAYGG